MPQLTFDDYWIRPIMTDRRCRRHGEALSTVELRNEGHEVTVPFAPRRTDALQEQTDMEMFPVLESADDGFRNYLRAGEKLPARTLLLDRANLLRLTAPQIDGSDRRPSGLDANLGQSDLVAFIDRPETLTRDFFANPLDTCLP